MSSLSSLEQNFKLIERTESIHQRLLLNTSSPYHRQYCTLIHDINQKILVALAAIKTPKAIIIELTKMDWDTEEEQSELGPATRSKIAELAAANSMARESIKNLDEAMKELRFEISKERMLEAAEELLANIPKTPEQQEKISRAECEPKPKAIEGPIGIAATLQKCRNDRFFPPLDPERKTRLDAMAREKIKALLPILENEGQLPSAKIADLRELSLSQVGSDALKDPSTCLVP